MENSIKNNNFDLHSKGDSIDINLQDIFESVLRRKIYFFYTLLISIGLGYYTTFDKPTWQGEFQIVIRSKQTKGGSSLEDLKSAGSVLSFLNNAGIGNNLKTEVKILESSSILNPIFNFVKDQKKLKDQNSKIKYKRWKDSLSISLVEGTSVLNIKYRDKNKELIIPVLNQLSNAYQNYSNRDQQSNLNNGIKYLNEQSILLKKTSQNSLNELMKFNIENNFFSIDDIKSPDELSFNNNDSLTFNFNSSGGNTHNASKLT